MARGPSPRVRGRRRGLAPSLDQRDHPRACGEDTTGIEASVRDRRDHPRACGEDAHDDALPRACWQGPPPRVRGRPGPAAHAHASGRDHPRACGEDVRAWVPASARRDHPRACGEDSTAWTSERRDRRDHPRACGEDRVNAGVDVPSTTGPPPRVRGRRSYVARGHEHAATGPPPRVRGRLRPATARGAPREGPPPRVRGRHFLTCAVVRSMSNSASLSSGAPCSDPYRDRPRAH